MVERKPKKSDVPLTLFINIGSILVVNHVVQVRHLPLRIGDDRKFQVGPGNLIDVLDPCHVRIQAVGALSWQSAAEILSPPVNRLLAPPLTNPISFTPRAVYSGSSLAKAPSSVVHVGVKSSCSGLTSSAADSPDIRLQVLPGRWRGSTHRVREKDHPIVTNKLMEIDGSIGCHRVEVGRG